MYVVCPLSSLPEMIVANRTVLLVKQFGRPFWYGFKHALVYDESCVYRYAVCARRKSAV